MDTIEKKAASRTGASPARTGLADEPESRNQSPRLARRVGMAADWDVRARAAGAGSSRRSHEVTPYSALTGSAPYGLIADSSSGDKPDFYVRRGASTYPALPNDMREAILTDVPSERRSARTTPFGPW